MSKKWKVMTCWSRWTAGYSGELAVGRTDIRFAVSSTLLDEQSLDDISRLDISYRQHVRQNPKDACATARKVSICEDAS
jgi:hypothetical protein